MKYMYLHILKGFVKNALRTSVFQVFLTTQQTTNTCIFALWFEDIIYRNLIVIFEPIIIHKQILQ